jgi:hypothetical protein
MRCPAVGFFSLRLPCVPVGVDGIRQYRLQDAPFFRWGKSGGYRVITFFTGTEIPVFLLNIFAKSEKTDLTPVEYTWIG